LQEIHGSLGRLQCSGNGSSTARNGLPCCNDLIPVDAAFLARMRAAEAAGIVDVPMCPKAGCGACLRPNVMIFGDYSLVGEHLDAQRDNFERFLARHKTGAQSGNWAVLEIGGGVVVPSIRTNAELYGAVGAGLIRINPSKPECTTMETGGGAGPVGLQYHPLCARSDGALTAILRQLGIGSSRAGCVGGSEGKE
jgi:NAD-dependent SIR2 family protein deacetylase